MEATGPTATSPKATSLESWFRIERPSRASESSPWTQKYAHLVEGIGDQLRSLSSWLRDYGDRVPGTPKGAFLLGPSGTGKTTCAAKCLSEAGLSVVERSSASHRTKRALDGDIVRTARSGPPNAILMEDIDTIAAGQGGLEVVTRLVNPLRGLDRPITAKDRREAASRWTVPIVCVANTCLTRGLSDLASDCLLIKFPRLSDDVLFRVAGRILVSERSCVRRAVVAEIVRLSEGDARALVQGLEFYVRTGGVVGPIDKESAIDEICARVFDGPIEPMTAAAHAFRDPISVCHVLQENYVLRDVGIDAAAEVSEFMSVADLFVNEDVWGPLVAYVPFMTAGAVSAVYGPTSGQRLVPGTSWSKDSYVATRQKQASRARDLLLGDPETVRFFASLIRRLSDAGSYDTVAAYARAYRIDAKAIDVLVKADRPDALKQKHRTVYKRLLP